MKTEDVERLDETLKELEKYNYSYIQSKVGTIRELLSPIIEAEKQKSFRVQRKLKYSWGSFDIVSRVQTMTNDLKSITKYHEEALEELRVYDNETQDILHALEFLENTDEEMKKMSEELAEIRKNRRKAKDFIELSTYLCDFADQNRQAVNKLAEASRNTKACFAKLERRTYTPREKTALAVAFEKLKEQEVTQ